jgi:hypothetical protein
MTTGFTNIGNISQNNYMVVDKDTGTVLNLNLVLVPVPQDEGIYEEVLSNDSAAFDYAQENGIALFVSTDAVKN